MNLTNHQFRLASRPVGAPKRSDWSYVEEQVREPADGERTRGGAERRAPPGEPRALRGHRRAPLLIELGRRRRNRKRFALGVDVL